MSVVGFDIGTTFSKIAVAHQKKISIVPNDLSKLTTPTLMAFTANERLFGEAAVSQWSRNYKCTIPQIKRLLGRQADDPTLQQELQDYFLISTTPSENGRIGIEVETSQGQAIILPEQALAPYISKLKQFTSHYLQGSPIRDCVIACPNYFDDAQRRSLLTAAKLADLNVLRLMNESTAIALNYGILRQLPQDATRRVIFCDVGEANTQVSVVDFVHGKLTVRYVAVDPFVGGRNFDLALFKYFSNLWYQQNSTPINGSKRATLRLMRECNSVKKILSANRDCVLPLDCFLDDVDFTLRIDRETATKEWEPILQNILKPLQEAVQETKNDNIKIHSVEMVGGASRIPSVQDKILQYIKSIEPDVQALSWTLNGDESVARGAALMCAMLSPNFKVKEFQVQDINTWPVSIEYVSDKGIETEQLIINRLNPSPCTAKVTFYKTQSFDFKLKLPSKVQVNENNVMNVVFPFSTQRDIGTFSVNIVPLSENLIGDPKIKVLVSLNKHGIVDCPQATLLETVKRIEAPNEQKTQLPPTDNKTGDVSASTTKTTEPMDVDQQQQQQEQQQNTSNKNENDLMDVDGAEDDNKEATNKNGNSDANVSENKESTDNAAKDPKDNTNANADNNNQNNNNNANSKPEEKKSDKKKIQRNLQVVGKFNNDIPIETFNKWYQFEASLSANDTVIHETHERRNELETYIYKMRNKLEGSHKDYISEIDRNNLISKLAENEQWLYGDGEDANKSSYVERLKNLHSLSDVVDERYHEGTSRPRHIERLKKLIAKYQSFADVTNDPQYNHITEEEKKQVQDDAKKCDEWLMEKIIQQERIPLYEKPILLIKDIDNKHHELMEQCQPIVNKPKPKPPKEEKKDDKTSATVDGNANANTNANTNAETNAGVNANTDPSTNGANLNPNDNVQQPATASQSSSKQGSPDLSADQEQQQQSQTSKDDIVLESRSDLMDVE